jgi:hypothetical protein
MKSHWSILACDLDGTLIGWDHKVNPRDLEALKRARTEGIHVAICTGRNSRECAGVIGALEIDGLGVFANGAMVCDMADGKIVHATYIPRELAEEAIEFFGTRGHAVLVLIDDPETRLPRYCMTDHAPPHRATTDWLLYNRVRAEQVVEVPVELSGRIARLGIVLNVQEEAAIHEALQVQFGTRCATHSIYSPHYDCQIIEMFHADVNKWTGLLHLAGKMEVDAGGIVAIGDDVNDLAMLRGASLSFAMGDAKEAVKAEARRITGSQAECGVAQVVDLLLVGGLEPGRL